MPKFEELVNKCDADIRSGRPQDVSRRLSTLNAARVPREWRLPLSNICRRAGLYSFGLILLSRVIFPGRTKEAPASLAEQAGYAMLLLRFGAVPEAIQRLMNIDAKQVPEVLLYRAFALFVRWEYEEAIPLLRTYLTGSLAPYARLVGQSNLAFAYVETRKHDLALDLLEELISATEKNKNYQLQGTCCALRAQLFTQERKFSEARKAIASASPLFEPSQGHDHFQLVKRKLILDGLEFKRLEVYDHLRRLAIENNDWEALRETDLCSLQTNFVYERFLHLYFGSPFKGFRRLMGEELRRSLDRNTYVLGSKKSPRFDLRTGEIDLRPGMILGGKCHELVAALLSDFYQPFRIAGLFSVIFPNEHFNISSSPQRVRQLIWRTRSWLEAHQIPVRILESDGFYSLRIEGDFSFRVPLDLPPLDRVERQIGSLREFFSGGALFSAREARDKLKLPKWTVHKILTSAIDQGHIERYGSTSRSASYRFVNSTERKSTG